MLDACFVYVSKLFKFYFVRLVTEDDKVYVYHNLENARVYHDNEIQSIEITPEVSNHSVQCYM